MPVQDCGKRGKKYGKGGKCYTGSGAKSRAAKQGRAIKSSQSKNTSHNKY